jgi:hypothetical protein
MARYSLILKDTTYVQLVQIAQAQGLSLGKYINESLNKLAASPEEKKNKRVCFVCGEKPIIEVHGADSGSIFLCEVHRILKKYGKGYIELKT